MKSGDREYKNKRMDRRRGMVFFKIVGEKETNKTLNTISSRKDCLVLIQISHCEL